MNGFQDEAESAAMSSIRRPREQAMAGGSRESFGTFTRNLSQDPQTQQIQQQQTVQPAQRIAIPSSARRELAGQGPPSSQKVSPRAPLPRPQATGGPSGMVISRPTPAPQWPLGAPLPSPADIEPYRPPPGRSEPPQRPPRPSHVPSILDSSKIQDQMATVFAYNTVNQAGAEEPLDQEQPPPPSNFKGSRVSDLSLAQQSSASSASRASTISSVGSIPDFPVPVSAPVAIPPPVAAVPLPRRSVNLGPPPSARRGASSFYSTVSYVSPIPEESPRGRSHTSYASSAAMPYNLGSSSSLALSPTYPDNMAYYDDIPEEGRESSNSGYGEDGSRSGLGSPDSDDMNLVRRASVGTRAKAALVSNNTPFGNGTGYVDASSSSELNGPSSKPAAASTLTPDNILDAYDAATAVDPSNPHRRSSVSPQAPFAGEEFGGSSRQYSRLSAIRRPPRLDIDAVRKAEARGSLTSLPDLIRRATRLAASLERGKRPGSRFDELNLLPGTGNPGDNSENNTERYRSGLSDMLAAFPPPGQPATRRSMRQSSRGQVGSWPMPYGYRNSRAGNQQNPEDGEYSDDVADMKNQQQRKRRRCCGLPLWGFVLTVIVILIVVAAAIIIPIEFFVIRKQNTTTLADCEAQITCANGGTNVVSAQGVCSCICTNDFTGFDCSVPGDNGCTTTDVSTTLTDVTLGRAIPRLIEQASANYSISLSGSEILSAFSSGNLSCTSENALVTFDGNSMRESSIGSTEVNAFNAAVDDEAVFASGGVAVVTVTVAVTASAAADNLRRAAGFSTVAGSPLIVVPSSTTTVTTTITPARTSTSSTASTTSSSTTTSAAGAGGVSSSSSSSSNSAMATGTLSSADPTTTKFTVTEDVLDFARVAVLFILQEESLSSAEGAQSALQRFFSNATTAAKKNESVADVAQNITLPNGNSINLVDLQVSAGTTLAGVGIS